MTELASIRSLMPGFYEFDEARSVLTTELLTSFNLLEYHQEVGQYPVAIGTALGDALAAVHSIDIDHIEPMLPSGLLRRKPPYALWRPWSNPAAVPFRATTEQYIASRPELCIELERIRDDMRSNSLIHADVKLDNITFTEAADGTIKIKLLDWELVDRGDAARDAGSVISNYVALAILRSTTKGNVSRADPTQQRLELAAVRPLLTAFWKRYARNRGFKSEESHRELVRCMRFAAARMIETACQNDASHPFCGLLIEAVEVILLDTQRAITLVVET